MKYLATEVDLDNDVTFNLVIEAENDLEALIMAATYSYGFDSVQEFLEELKDLDKRKMNADWSHAIGDRNLGLLCLLLEDDQYNSAPMENFLLSVYRLDDGHCCFKYDYNKRQSNCHRSQVSFYDSANEYFRWPGDFD